MKTTLIVVALLHLFTLIGCTADVRYSDGGRALELHLKQEPRTADADRTGGQVAALSQPEQRNAN